MLAQAYRGTLGYGLKGYTHKHTCFTCTTICQMMISVVDKQEKLETAIDAIAPILLNGLIVFSSAESVRLVHSLPPEIRSKLDRDGRSSRSYRTNG